jgi:putative membrane protein
MQVWTSYWHPDVVALFVSGSLILFHILSNGGHLARKSTLFLGGVGLLLVMTSSPLSFLGRHYLFSAHMIVHVVVLLVVPPLLLAGTEGRFLNRLVEKPVPGKILSIVAHPVIAWLFGVGSMWALHAPVVFITLERSSVLMEIQMIALLVFGGIFAWPVFSPVRTRKLDPLSGALYLFLACTGCTVLGILITFSASDLYGSAMTGNDSTLWTLIRSGWGITPQIDQQIGGLIMWVPACMIYLTSIMITLARWYLTPETEESAKS